MITDDVRFTLPVRVLVADDDALIRTLMKFKLEKLGCEVVTAVDGAEAWDRACSEIFDLAVIDLSMPRMDGFELIACMRSHPKTKHLPIVVITSSVDHDSVQRAFCAGATSFLTKPLQWGLVGSHLEFLLRLSAQAREDRLRIAAAHADLRLKEALLGKVLGTTAALSSRLVETVQALSSQVSASMGKGDRRPTLDDVALLADSIEATVNDGLFVATQLSRRAVLSDAVVPVSSILGSAMQRVQAEASRRDVTVSCRGTQDDPQVACDPAAMSEAIWQLLDNAVRHSRPGGDVRIESQLRPDGLLTLEILDQGCGMDPELAAWHVSPLGCIGPETMPVGAPVGLGLPVAKAIAEAHGGALEIRSMPGQGTTVLLAIPPDRVASCIDAVV